MALQAVFWPLIQPVSWFLAYPAVFFSSWAGGLRSGLAATALCTVLEWWFFVPPAHGVFKGEPRDLVRAAAFVLMGVLFSIFQERLRRSLQTTARALEEREKSQTALSRSEAALRRAQSIAHIGNWSLDFAQGRLESSDELARIFGRSTGDKLTWPEMREAIYPGDRQHVDHAWAAALEGKPYDIEYRIVVQGQLCWVREIGQVQQDYQGKAMRGSGTVQDVTPRRVAQARMEQVYRANRALSKCNEALIRATEEEKLLQQICQIVVEDAGYPLCWVGKAEHDEARTVRILAQSNRRSGYLEGIRVSWADSDEGRGPVGTCIRTGQTVTVRDIAADPAMVPWRQQALRYGYTSSLAIPLLVEGQMFGAFAVYAPEPDAFSNEEVGLLSELAADLAFGIGALRTREQRAAAEEELRALNAELEERVMARTAELQQAREREGEIGNRIQQTLLLDQAPQHIPSLRVSALSLPTEIIDGDFYAFIEAREGSLDVLVGDVMGKGVPAALLGAATKTQFLKALGHLTMAAGTDGLPQPEAIVMRAHAEIAKKLIELESFVTLCYARFDTRAAEMQFVDCGHTGIIHLHSGTGKADLLHGNQLPLGVSEEEVYTQTKVAIARGDLLVFFSDGITDARSPSGELFGIERLLDIVRAADGEEPSALIELVRASLREFCACERPSDDITIVGVRIEETGEPIAKAEIILASDLGQLRQVRRFVDSFCATLTLPQLDEDAVSELTLATNEVASNIMKHAYGGRADQVIVVEGHAYPDRIFIRMRHRGIPFSPPDVVPLPEITRESGFGLYMLSRSVDEVHYYRDGQGRNCVALVKRPSRTSEQVTNHGNAD